MPDRKKPIIIFGAGGHARSVIDVMRAENKYEIIGLIDSYQKKGNKHFGCTILGAEKDVPVLIDKYRCFNLFVAVGDNFQRQSISQRLLALSSSISFVTTIHPSVVISPGVQLGSGIVIMPGAIINSGTSIADGCLINTRASIDHDCCLGSFSSVAPGATLGGKVTVAERSAIALGANVKNGIVIGRDTVIGVGAVVVKDIPEAVIAFGLPCRVVKRRQPNDSYL